MKKGILKTFLFIVMLILAVVLGKAAASACADVRYLSWLAASAGFGFSPVKVDLSVVSFTFGLSVDIDAAQALLLLAAVFIETRIRVKG